MRERKTARELLQEVQTRFLVNDDAMEEFKLWLVRNLDCIHLDCWEVCFVWFIHDYFPEAEGKVWRRWLTSFYLHGEYPS